MSVQQTDVMPEGFRSGESLLFEEHPILLQCGVAQIFGLTEALVLQQIQYWLKNPYFDEKLGDGIRLRRYKGALWARIPPQLMLDSWSGKLRVLSQSTIKRAISSLRKQGVLETTTHLNKRGDNTNWYSINREILNRYEKVYQTYQGRIDHEREIAMEGGQETTGHRDIDKEEALYNQMEEEMAKVRANIKNPNWAQGQNDTVAGSPVGSPESTGSKRTGHRVKMALPTGSKRTGHRVKMAGSNRNTEYQQEYSEYQQHQSRLKNDLIDDDASLKSLSTTAEAKPDSVDDSKVLLEWLTTAGKIPRELAARLIGSSPIPQMGAQELVSALRELGGRGSGPTSPRALVAADAAAVRRQLLVWPHCNEADSDKVRNKYGILVSKIQSDDSPPPELRETLPKYFSSNSSEVDNKRLKAEQRECSAYWKSLSEHQQREFDRDFKIELQERYPGQYIAPSAPEYEKLRRAHLQDAKTREWLASIAPESGEFVESEELGPDRVPEPDTAVVAEAAEAAEPEEIDRLQITADELLQEIGHGNASVESLESDIAEFYPQFDDDERAEIAALVRERLGESPEE